jgi:hypothetical protein
MTQEPFIGSEERPDLTVDTGAGGETARPLSEIMGSGNFPKFKEFAKEFKDRKEYKDHKDQKDRKDHKDTKDHKDIKDHKEQIDHKEFKDHKDLADKDQFKEHVKDLIKDRIKEIETKDIVESPPDPTASQQQGIGGVVQNAGGLQPEGSSNS